MNEVKQIRPNHADHISSYKEKWLNELYTFEPVIAQPKYDGERMLIHIDGRNIYCTSRRISKKTNKFMQNEDRLQVLQNAWHDIYDQLTDFGQELGYTVLDCECYQKDWSTIIGILHSLPERAATLCEATPPKFAIFDCLWYDGVCLEERPYIERLKYASFVLSVFNFENMHLVQFMNDELKPDTIKHAHFFKNSTEQEQAMQNAIDAGFEGIVVKSLTKTYRDVGASLKCKKFETVDVVVYDYIQGRGKYSDTVGALSIGYYDPITSNIKHISQVNCGTDAERNMWHDRWSELKGSVIEVKCQEVTETSLRHPVYIRLREDKTAEMCTKETIFKEV